MKTILFIACGALFLAGCEQHSADTSAKEEQKPAEEISGEEVLRSARETLNKTATFLDQERKALAEKLEKEVIALDQKIQQLKKEAPEKFGPMVKELEKTRDELIRTWGEVQQLSKEKIDEMIQRFHHGWKEADLDSTLPTPTPTATPQ